MCHAGVSKHAPSPSSFLIRCLILCHYSLVDYLWHVPGYYHKLLLRLASSRSQSPPAWCTLNKEVEALCLVHLFLLSMPAVYGNVALQAVDPSLDYHHFNSHILTVIAFLNEHWGVRHTMSVNHIHSLGRVTSARSAQYLAAGHDLITLSRFLSTTRSEPWFEDVCLSYCLFVTKIHHTKYCCMQQHTTLLSFSLSLWSWALFE